MSKCSICKVSDLCSRAEISTGICYDCRVQNGWQDCSHCANVTIPPNGGACMNCLSQNKSTEQSDKPTKRYTDQCPCGLIPSQCTYHNGS